jgi:hypothetical protein
MNKPRVVFTAGVVFLSATLSVSTLGGSGHGIEKSGK